MSHLPPAKVHDVTASLAAAGVSVVVRLDGHSLHLELTHAQATQLHRELGDALTASSAGGAP